MTKLLPLNKIIQGDCIEVMRDLPENSIDAVLTDPPYGLEFMGKYWDKFKKGKNIGGGTMKKRDTPYQGKTTPPSYYHWTLKEKNTYQEFSYKWAKECLRVLKPGGYLLSFGGTRMYHRMTCGIEDVGFEIRDCIMWIYGSGFPKSHNVANAIDKLQGKPQRGHAIASGSKYHPTTGKARSPGEFLPPYKARTELGKKWKGWGTALKPACEPIVVSRKPLSEKTIAKNVLKWGTAGMNIDECRIPAPEGLTKGGLTKFGGVFGNQGEVINKKGHQLGRFPANLILDEKSAEILDKQSGDKRGQSAPTTGKEPSTKRLNIIYGDYRGYGKPSQPKDKLGGASRFFYVAKASRAERNLGCEGLKNKPAGMAMRDDKFTRENMGNTPAVNREPVKNNHPTVKPVKLMEYLIRLITPPKGIVLDPFIGSGTTAIACKKLGFNYIGIEKEAEYVEIAKGRIKAQPKPLL